MREFPFAVTEESVLDVCLIDDAFGYFEFAEAFSELIENGHIEVKVRHGEKYYKITDKGLFAAEVFEKQVPLSVREKAEKAVVRVVYEIRRQASLMTDLTYRERDGMSVAHMCMGEEGDEIMSLDMTVPNEYQGKRLIANFRKNAERIYNEILKALLKDYEEQCELDKKRKQDEKRKKLEQALAEPLEPHGLEELQNIRKPQEPSGSNESEPQNDEEQIRMQEPDELQERSESQEADKPQEPNE